MMGLIIIYFNYPVYYFVYDSQSNYSLETVYVSGTKSFLLLQDTPNGSHRNAAIKRAFDDQPCARWKQHGIDKYALTGTCSCSFTSAGTISDSDVYVRPSMFVVTSVCHGLLCWSKNLNDLMYV